MKWVQIAWSALAVAAVGAGLWVGEWPLYQIADCEIGLYSAAVPNAQTCNAPIRDYFGGELYLVLAVPVALCVVPAIFPRPLVAWSVTWTLLAAASIGLAAVVVTGSASIVATAGSVPITLCAFVLSTVQWWAASRSNPVVREESR